MILTGKTVLITGGTGSLGKVLLSRILTGEVGVPRKVIVFSRDEAKQHFMRLAYLSKTTATDEVIYENFRRTVEFRIGDVRDYPRVAEAARKADIIVNAAALKQVPTCEYFPEEAVRTNVLGPANIVRAICEQDLPVQLVVGVSTDKACKPVNAMGMTKALQERTFISANLQFPQTRFVCVRYGNVLASRGSVIPLFRDQIRRGGPVTITTPEMTRFLLSLDDAVNVIFAAMRGAGPGETYIPRVPSARVADIARALIGNREITTVMTGIRPGEKVHEVLVSEEECWRTVERWPYYVIQPALPELRNGDDVEISNLGREYSSRDDVLDLDGVHQLLDRYQLLVNEPDNSLEYELVR